MPDPKTSTSAGSADSLTAAGGVSLSESELEKVTGGDASTMQTTQTITLNKTKVADKNAAQADAYIRG